MADLGVREADLEEKFIQGSGSGGQKINKTSSCVYLRHGPTGIEVKCQKTRYRELNRFLARRSMCDRIRDRLLGARSALRQEAERIRRQKRRRSRRQKQRMLECKRRQAEKKRGRSAVDPDAD
ncbi:MAG: peptide chain release factor-like protein [Lentisphaerae bacterium]|nr:peptide chain release factor-like protein [Lentisphaerota bacterium]